MSELPLSPIFSAAHVSKWDALPEDTFISTTKSGFELERPTRPSVNYQSNNDADRDACVPSESSKSDEGVFSRCECEIAVQVAAHVGSAVATKPPACGTVAVGPHGTKSRADLVTLFASYFVLQNCGLENMAVKTYTWITLWFLLTAPVIFWDATYCFMRPRSMVGGDLHWIWEPYGLYQEIDLVYGIKALEENNGFTNAQSFLNLVETALNLAYVYLAHVSSWSGAPVVGFAAVTMTLSKTVLYWAQEYYCGGCAVGHNTWGNLLLYWVLPNGFWLVFPSMIVWRLGGDIVGSLSAASQSARKAVSGKTQ